jgi:MFS transporter, OFA family, oxalate/formate antiporter
MRTYMSHRSILAIAGVFMQMALGAVYAWSVFRIPLTHSYGWTVSQVTLAFELAILVLGFAAFAGGIWMRRSGPRRVAIAAAVLYGLGTALAGFSHNLTMLYLTYGVIGGAGLGLGYIVPIATLVRWFPDKRGMITGIAVAGFGAGALVTAPIAQRLIASVGVSGTFLILGIAYFVIILLAAIVMQNPPAGYAPAGFQPASVRGLPAREFSMRQALGTWQWYGLWLTLFLNTTAGIKRSPTSTRQPRRGWWELSPSPTGPADSCGHGFPIPSAGRPYSLPCSGSRLRPSCCLRMSRDSCRWRCWRS